MTSVDRIQGLSGSLAIKAPVRVATTAALALVGEQTIDGIACVAGDRVLVKDQVDTTTNGIYDVSTGAWSRSVDADGNNDLRDGTLVLCSSGSTNADLMFKLNATDPVVIGTTALTFGISAVFDEVSSFGASLLTSDDAAEARTALEAVAKTGDTLTGGLIFKAGLNNIASAATVNLTALGANTAHITGTTPIGAWTMTSGQVVDLVFDGALLLTHHATNNNLPGGTNFTVQAGDRATYWYDGTTVRCMAYQRVNGGPLYGVLTPAQITADQNDYSPSGITGVSMVRLSSDAARNITGLSAWNDTTRTIFLHNAGSYAITLKDESSSSQTYNRFALTADLVLQPDQVALLQYDVNSYRWRHVNATPTVTAAITAGTALVKNPVAFSSTTTQAHGLGARPTLFNVALECLTAESGYAIGNIINYGDGTGGGSNYGINILSDATNTTLLISPAIAVMHKTSYTGVAITAANWKITVTPYKVS